MKIDTIIKETKKRKKLIKRSYTLKESTVLKLQKLKVFYFPIESKYNDIVDLAIRELYKQKTGKN